jgi:hypothetical protein
MRCAGRPGPLCGFPGRLPTLNVEPESTGRTSFERMRIFSMESLILAQNERWRHGLGMQVERDAAMHLVAKGCATREEPAPGSRISAGNGV